jgi:hypothetical protein
VANEYLELLIVELQHLFQHDAVRVIGGGDGWRDQILTSDRRQELIPLGDGKDRQRRSDCILEGNGEVATLERAGDLIDAPPMAIGAPVISHSEYI